MEKYFEADAGQVATKMLPRRSAPPMAQERLNLGRRLGGFVLLVAGIAATMPLAAAQAGLIRPQTVKVGSMPFEIGTSPTAPWQCHVLGLAWFVGMTCGWTLASRVGVTRELKWLARVGAIGSLALLGLLAYHQQGPALWWMAQLLNVTFWLLIETCGAAWRHRQRNAFLAWCIVPGSLLYALATYWAADSPQTSGSDSTPPVVESNATSPATATQSQREDVDEAASKLAEVSQGTAPRWTSEKAARAIAATVRVTNPASNSQGSGSVVGLDPPWAFVLTANHLIGEATSVDVLWPAEVGGAQPPLKTGRVMERWPDQDLALVRVTNAAAQTCTAIAASGPRDAALPTDVVSVGWSEGQSASAVEGKLLASRRVRRPDQTAATQTWELDLVPTAGRSGGPLLNLNGELIGICNGGSDGKTYCCHLTEIRKLLASNELKRFLAPQPRID